MDYIWLRQRQSRLLLGCYTIDCDYSDHLPVVLDVDLGQPVVAGSQIVTNRLQQQLQASKTSRLHLMAVDQLMASVGMPEAEGGDVDVDVDVDKLAQTIMQQRRCRVPRDFIVQTAA